ncbi:hypothetical protein [Sphingobium xenophagum]|uniref:hypothetical protein n=1 Tax=Sphingobium xenophagum TaxID=121428 RepID=UPI0002FE492D|nr:hypothetical protein [Sphingobium xenophagum]
MTTLGIIALVAACAALAFCSGVVAMGVMCARNINDLVVENEVLREQLDAESA